MLYFLHNRIERTFAFTAAGVSTFWLANSNFLFRPTTKLLFALFLDGWLYVFAVTLSSENTHTRK